MTRPVKPAEPAVRAPRARGRPRSEQLKQAALQAARELLAEGGLGAVTMEGVAARAGVGKPTVYRWWPDRHAVAMAALMEAPLEAPPGPRARTALRALREQLRAVANRFSTATGRQIATMIAAADSETELARAFRSHFVLARREEGRRLLELAAERGEIRGGLDVDVALDLIYGALFFRLLMGHAVLDERFTDRVLDEFLRGLKG
jgi:AcrR family transcriptional regulator